MIFLQKGTHRGVVVPFLIDFGMIQWQIEPNFFYTTEPCLDSMCAKLI